MTKSETLAKLELLKAAVEALPECDIMSVEAHHIAPDSPRIHFSDEPNGFNWSGGTRKSSPDNLHWRKEIDGIIYSKNTPLETKTEAIP